MPKLPAKEVTTLMKECVAAADRLAEKARLALDSEPLPAGTDFSDEEYDAIVEQARRWQIFRLRNTMYLHGYTAEGQDYSTQTRGRVGRVCFYGQISPASHNGSTLAVD